MQDEIENGKLTEPEEDRRFIQYDRSYFSWKSNKIGALIGALFLGLIVLLEIVL